MTRNRKTENRMKALANALHVEKQVSLELCKALRVQMAIADGLRRRLEEIEKGEGG